MLCIEDNLDIITGSSNSQIKLSIVVVEDIKTSLASRFMTLPAILPIPNFVLDLNFIELLREEPVRYIERNAKIATKFSTSRPRSLVNPGTPCVLVRVCESWWKLSHCLTRKHFRVRNYLCFLKIKDLNGRTNNCW